MCFYLDLDRAQRDKVVEAYGDSNFCNSKLGEILQGLRDMGPETGVVIVLFFFQTAKI